MDKPIRPRLLVSGSYEAQGKRNTMEDAHIHSDDIPAPTGGHFSNSKIAFYGVYDGHGGKSTADYIQAELHNRILNSPDFTEGRVKDSLEKGFLAVDRDIVEKANSEGWMNGSTAVVALIVDNVLHVANVGDAEACLVAFDGGEMKVENLTYPHKASDADEKKRIEELGGHVFFGRVFGALAVSRAFGDSRYKQPKTSQNFVTADPNYVTFDLNSSHKYIILACDGLWDVCSHEDAATFVHEAFKKNRSPEEVAKDLVQQALDLKTDDNVTVVIVKLEWDDDSSVNETPAVPEPVQDENVEGTNETQ